MQLKIEINNVTTAEVRVSKQKNVCALNEFTMFSLYVYETAEINLFYNEL